MGSLSGPRVRRRVTRITRPSLPEGRIFKRVVSLALARTIHEGFVNNPGLPDEQPFPLQAGGYVVVGGHRAVSPCTGDDRSVQTADHTGFYLARIVRELCSRIMRASACSRATA
jgi:hypothetical protein